MAVYKFAGFWRRLVAYAIDGVIINIIFAVLLMIVLFALLAGAMSGVSGVRLSDMMESLSFLGLVVFTFYIVLSISYFTYFHGINGRTPGKMLLGLQVLSVDGNPVSFGIAFLRSVGYLVSAIFYIGFIWVAFDHKKQGWHDKIAATVVIIRPGESQTASLTIPEPQTASDAAQRLERRNESNGPEIIQPLTANEDENNAAADQADAAAKKYLDKIIHIL
jgi:uncharacterized RDD family membrane protein YckC